MPADYRPPKRSTQISNAKKKSKSKPSGFNPLLLWGGIGGAVLLVIAIVLVVVSSSGPSADVAVVTPNVEPDTTQPDVPPPLPKPKAKAFSERAAAEWVVSVGGRVRVLEPGRASYDVYISSALPKGDFHIETLGLDGIDAVNDQQVEQLWGLQTLSELGLSRTKVTDLGLEWLPQLQSLSSLNLKGCPITDKGLAWLGRMPNLKFLVADGGIREGAVRESRSPSRTTASSASPSWPSCGRCRSSVTR